MEDTLGLSAVMDHEVPEAVHDAYKRRDLETARRLLDEWEAGVEPTLESLKRLRYWRRMLGQQDQAILATQRMIRQRPVGAWERISDLLHLGQLYLDAERFDACWMALQDVVAWDGFRASYGAGLGRSAVELALDLSAAKDAGDAIRRDAYALAARLLDDGISWSLSILEKVRDRADAFGDQPRHARFASAARDARRGMQSCLRRPPAA